MRKEKRIPTILGLLLLVGSTMVGVYLTSSSKNTNTHASGDCRPNNLQVTNVSYQSASISFETSNLCQSNIKINGTVVQDYRQELNSQNSTPKAKIHYFQASALKENTLYQFEVISGGDSFTSNDYRVKTAAKPASAIPTSNLAWGKVYTADKQPASGVVVYLNISGAAPLSALVTTSGNWNISFASSFNQALTNWFTPPSDADEEIVVIAEDGSQTVLSASTSRNNPVPDIILGQNFFNESTTSNNNSSNLFTQTTPTQSLKKLAISYPTEAEVINSLKPEFVGTGPQNTSVTIKVSNFTQNWEVVPDSVGNWKWTPPSGLLPGANTLTVSTGNQQLSRSFTISVGTNGLAFEASSSAIPTQAVLLPTATLIPLAPTLAPTITIVPTQRAYHPSTESGVPSTGVGSFTIALILSAAFLIIISLHLLKKSDTF